MKTNESLLHKGMRAIVQSTLRREANEPYATPSMHRLTWKCTSFSKVRVRW